MLGDMEPGRRDLDRALELDPELRQGWLNRAALAVAEERYADAVAAFRRAEALDPAAPENDLNVGTAQLLQHIRRNGRSSWTSFSPLAANKK